MAKKTPAANIIAMRTAGGPHSGLHSLHVAAAHYPALAEVNRVATDSRVAGIYAADVRLNGGKAPKRSSFFPAVMAWAAIPAAVSTAWRDSRIYRPDSQIYDQLAEKYGLSWVGLATIQGQRIWIGSTRSGTAANPIETAFPAVDDKFF